MNQSKLEAIVCSKARENLCERVTIGFCFTSDWMKKRREFITRGGGDSKRFYTERLRPEVQTLTILYTIIGSAPPGLLSQSWIVDDVKPITFS